jgi:hypothetical protein
MGSNLGALTAEFQEQPLGLWGGVASARSPAPYPERAPASCWPPQTSRHRVSHQRFRQEAGAADWMGSGVLMRKATGQPEQVGGTPMEPQSAVRCPVPSCPPQQSAAGSRPPAACTSRRWVGSRADVCLGWEAVMDEVVHLPLAAASGGPALSWS